MTPRSSIVGALSGLGICACVALLATGCGDAEAQTPVVVHAGDLPCADAAPESDGSWQSAPLPPLDASCVWLQFDGTTTYVIDHPLGRTPRQVSIYLAFDGSGAPASLAAGDEALIQAADDSTLTLRNATHQRFYARLLLR